MPGLGQALLFLQILLLASTVRMLAPVVATRGSRRIEGLLFDCDGTICETEIVTLESFNEAFSTLGLDIYWDVPLYSELLKVGASRERVTHYFDNHLGFWPSFPLEKPPTPEQKIDFALKVQDEKNQAFQRVWTRRIEEKSLRLRPGIVELINEAIRKKVKARFNFSQIL